MTRWQDLSVGNRIAITFAIVLAIVFALALYGYLTGGWEDDSNIVAPSFALASVESAVARNDLLYSDKPIECIDAELKDRVRNIMLDALDAGLKERIVHVYEGWVIDDRDQPRRATTGARKAVRAYAYARIELLKWDPPPCKRP